MSQDKELVGHKPVDVNHFIVIRFEDEWVELGAKPDMFRKTMAAIHHVNRNSEAQHCAVAFPTATKSAFGIGNIVTVFGDTEILNRLKAHEDIAGMKKKGMIGLSFVMDTDLTVEDGIFATRIRKNKFATEAQRQTAIRRAVRNGKTLKFDFIKKRAAVEIEGTVCQAKCYVKKDVIVDMAMGKRKFDPNQEFTVNSYGLSAKKNLVVLPSFL